MTDMIQISEVKDHILSIMNTCRETDVMSYQDVTIEKFGNRTRQIQQVMADQVFHHLPPLETDILCQKAL